MTENKQIGNYSFCPRCSPHKINTYRNYYERNEFCHSCETGLWIENRDEPLLIYNPECMQGMDLKIKYRNPDENIEKKLNEAVGCDHLFKTHVNDTLLGRYCNKCGKFIGTGTLGSKHPDVRLDINRLQRRQEIGQESLAAEYDEKLKNPRCENCKYFSEGVKGIGQCRRDTPKIIEDDYVGQWPGIHSDDWCGEFDLK